ncbi:FAD-binding oxidoreductase [Aspergillus stella-maris]|uniref:FAD-binding oxidoreductase n=1 Tax=Aspergillus stella-maris TaxID=1810926 RepID=UPI003CCDDB9C
MARRLPSDLIEDLKKRLTGNDQVLTPESPGYYKALQRWSDLASKQAGAIIYPECPEDVSSVVVFAQQHNIDLAVKGGGHTPDGANCSDGGIVIDLARMNKVSLHPNTNTLVAEGGALWRDVNNSTAGTGLAVVSSSIGTTGVGGVTIQGGYGYAIGEHGLAIDNLLEVQIVIADGKVLRASENENSDLFWAVRGAGSNFGVVVEFTFRTFPQPNKVFAGSVVYTTDRLAPILESMHAALQYGDGKTAAQCVLYQPRDSVELMLNVGLCHNGPEAECRERLAKMFSFEAVSDNMQMRTYEEANAMLDSFSPPGGRKRLLGFEFVSPLRLDFVQDMLNEITIAFQSEPDLRRTYIDIEFWNMVKVSTVPTMATAFPTREPTQKGSIALEYTDPAKDDEYLRWGIKLRDMFREELERYGFKPNRHVSNFTYFTEATEMTVEDMYGVNAERLLELKQKYDPHAVFNKLNPIRVQGSKKPVD